MDRKTLLSLYAPGAWRAYLKRYAPFRWTLAFSAAVSVAQALLVIPLAFLVKTIFDRMLAKAGLYELLLPCAAILALTVLSVAASLVARHYALKVTKIVIKDLRLALMEKSYALAEAFSNTVDRGRLHSIIVQDTERVDVGSNAIVVVALPAIVTSTVFLAALAYLAPWLLLAALVCLPLVILCHRTIGRTLQALVERFRASFETFDENVLGALKRMELTRVRGAQAFEMAQQERFTDDLRRTSGRMAWVATAYSVVQSAVTTLVSVVTLLVGGTAVALGLLSLSSLAAYYFILAQLGGSLSALWNAIPQILQGLDSLNNMTRMANAERRAPAGGMIEHRLGGAIEFRGVHFSYGGEPLLAGIDLKIAPGERVAILGPNGSGKSTLAYLLMGLYEPRQGEIAIDGIPLHELSLDHYRRQVGVVLQDMPHFAGTVMENITYGHGNARQDDVDRTLALSRTDAFIANLPDGYETQLGAPDVSLSGGQSQSVGLARALLGRPKLLILDEPTNHLDEAATAALTGNLETLDFHPTIVLITHNRALAARCDRAYRIEDHRLIELEQRASSRLRAIGGGDA